MKPTIRHLQPPPPPPAPACAADPAAHEPDTRPAAVRIGDRKLRRALVKYVAACRVPEREVEDVVQRALASAWAKTEEWPPTQFELERWMFTLAHHRAVDEHRSQARRPLARPKPVQDGSQDDASGRADDDPADDGEIGPVVTAPETLEMREGLRLAEAEVAKHPSWRRAFGWTLRTLSGESYEDIAVADGVTEEAVKSAVKRLRGKLRKALPDVTALFLFVALALVIYGAIHKKREEAIPPAPKPEHSIVAPSPAPVAPSPPAEDLRRRAFAACDAHAWAECLRDFDAARDVDPAGDDEPQVQIARTKALQGMQSKYGPK